MTVIRTKHLHRFLEFQVKVMDSLSIGYVLSNHAIDHNYQLNIKKVLFP